MSNKKKELRSDAVLLIHKKTCEIMGVDYLKSLTKSRNRELVDSRHMTFICIKDVFKTKYALEQIGAPFGNNHSSVLHGIKKTRNLLEFDSNIKSYYKKIISFLQKNYLNNSREVLTKNEFINEIKKELRTQNIINIKINIRDLLTRYN